MPLVAHSPLPAFEKLRQRGEKVLSLEQAVRQDIRELHVGLLNMMPDAALVATEMQFMRLIGSSNQIAQFFVHPFSVGGLVRSEESQTYIEKYYRKFEHIKGLGLDALVITGANVSNPNLEDEPFWQPLLGVIAWAQAEKIPVLCSCLATHALVQHLYHVRRTPMKQKLWGVYSHRVLQPGHPLLRDINTRFDVPHSRFNEVRREQLESAGLTVLCESEEAGVHLAVSPDQMSIVFFQGHPEYDTNSLLKEYKREVNRFINSERDDYPPMPEHYFGEDAQSVASEYQAHVKQALAQGEIQKMFPETHMEALLDNTWRDTAKSIVNNWMGLVYEQANFQKPKWKAEEKK